MGYILHGAMMNKLIEDLESTTFGGHRFTKKRLEEIQTTVSRFSNLSRAELANTICEHLQWLTAKGRYRNMLYFHSKKEIQAIFRLKINSHKAIDQFITDDETDKIITINPTSSTRRDIRKKHPEINIAPLKLRLIRYVAGGTTYILGTTLLNQTNYEAKEFFQTTQKQNLIKKNPPKESIKSELILRIVCSQMACTERSSCCHWLIIGEAVCSV